MTRRTEEIDAAIAELRRWGAADVRLVDGGKHPRLTFTWRGQARTLLVSGTPSERNARHLIREHVREALGIVRQKRVGVRRVRHSPRKPVKAAPPPATLTPGRDPFRPLQGTELLRGALVIAADRAWRAFFAARLRAAGHEPVHPGLRSAA